MSKNNIYFRSYKLDHTESAADVQKQVWNRQQCVQDKVQCMHREDNGGHVQVVRQNRALTKEILH